MSSPKNFAIKPRIQYITQLDQPHYRNIKQTEEIIFPECDLQLTCLSSLKLQMGPQS